MTFFIWGAPVFSTILKVNPQTRYIFVVIRLCCFLLLKYLGTWIFFNKKTTKKKTHTNYCKCNLYYILTISFVKIRKRLASIINKYIVSRRLSFHYSPKTKPTIVYQCHLIQNIYFNRTIIRKKYVYFSMIKSNSYSKTICMIRKRKQYFLDRNEGWYVWLLEEAD